MTTDSRPEPPAGSPPTAPVPAVRAPSHHRTTPASVVLGTVGALVAVGIAVALAAPRAEPVRDDQAVLLDDRAVPPPSFALVTRAWSDDDADGLRGAEEPPLAGVVVRLETADAQPARHVDGSVVGPATTGADGTAVFDDVADGVYRVRWALPAGYALTTAVAAPGHVSTDSDAEPVGDDRADGLSGPVALTEAADLDLPAPAEGLTADRVLRGVDLGAAPAAEVLGVALG